MKKIILMMLLVLFPIKVEAISASAYILMDSDNNRVLEGSNIHTKHLIASITKIMTSMVVINNSNLEKEVTMGEEILKSYGSGIYVEVGEKMSIQNLLYGLMLRSGNDAAIALAFEIGGSMEGFATLMNETALNIGMKNTTFLNSHGLENEKKEGNLSTAYDMALLSSYAVNNKTYQKIASTKKITVTTNYKTYVWYNKNRLLNEYEYCTGGKTGFTELAKRTLVTNASKDNMNLTVVTFRDGNDFKDHEDLYEKIFKSYQNYEIVKKGKLETKYDNTYIDEGINMTLTKSEYQKIKTSINYYNENVTNIIGDIEVSLDGKVYEKRLIYVKEIKAEPKLSFWEKIKRKLGIND